jgi:hypothetical protein
MNDTLQRLQEAAVKLSQCGSIKDRLADAYRSHLIEVDADELPENYRHEYGDMCEAMRRAKPLPREDVVRASVRKMSNDEANRYAALVVKLFGAMARTGMATTSRNHSRKAPLSPIVQLFAADG